LRWLTMWRASRRWSNSCSTSYRIRGAQNLAVGLFAFLKEHGIDPLTATKPN
jgi:hypothetical protein